jgi:hypothetical protein
MVPLERKTLDALFDTLKDWNSVLENEGLSKSDLKNPGKRGPRP